MYFLRHVVRARKCVRELWGQERGFREDDEGEEDRYYVARILRVPLGA
jgi:hypothetical protein